MSCLNLTKLLPRTKLWKLFKNKLPLKVHKLTSSKAIKKHIQQQRQRPNNNKSQKKLSRSSLSIQPKRFKKKVHNNYKGRAYFNKKVPPIYVDELFIEPTVAIESTHGSSERVREATKTKAFKPSSSSNGNSSKRSADRDKNTMTNPDDMWESLAMTSPQMDGIDERAEEFIARFRAEMQNQENMIARLL